MTEFERDLTDLERLAKRYESVQILLLKGDPVDALAVQWMGEPGMPEEFDYQYQVGSEYLHHHHPSHMQVLTLLAQYEEEVSHDSA